MWLTLLENFKGVSLLTPMHDVTYSQRAFATDAPDWGFVAMFHNQWFQAHWPQSEDVAYQFEDVPPDSVGIACVGWELASCYFKLSIR